MSGYEKHFDFWKYEKKVLNKPSKLSVLMADNAHLGLPIADCIEELSNVGGKNRKHQIELLDKRIDKIHKEIKRLPKKGF